MSTRRLRARLPEAVPRCAAALRGFRLVLNKPGRDGSGKANLVPHPDAICHGVLYALHECDWLALDRHERGYERRTCRVVADPGPRAGQAWTAQAYFWTADTPELPAFDWYVAYLLEGAREHRLPADYVSRLSALPVRLASRRSASRTGSGGAAV